MLSRDRTIVKHLEMFRVMSRDQIATIHFSRLKDPVKQANTVLKRLRRDGYIEADTNQRKYLYFPKPSSLTKDGNKVKHFLAIADVYAQLQAMEEPKHIEVEAKYGKGNPEPDMFVIWRKHALFIEIQRSYYNAKKYEDKFERYERFYFSDEWKSLAWQPADKKIFPKVWIIGEQQFNWQPEFKVIQSKVVADVHL